MTCGRNHFRFEGNGRWFFPRAAWDFQVRAAYNLAAAFDEVHRAGCVVGDVQLRNAYVSPKASVRLVDCDSFQVRANGKVFLCEVGLSHYIPPELQGKSLRGLVRTENHDRFGLAVLLYQLLFVGRHPYAGVYRGPGDPSFEQLIAEFRFAQGPLARSWAMDPPPHTPTFADIPQEVGMLFRRAFERGSERDARPRPAEWLPALERLEENIVECPADAGHKYWRGAGNCVWCRLAAKGGPEYYFGVAGGIDTFAVDEVKLQDVLRRLNACQPVEFRYDRRRFTAALPPAAEPLPEGLNQHRSVAIILGIAIALCVLALPLGLIHGAICLFAFLGVLVMGTWLGIHSALSPWHREHRRRRRACDLALDELYEIEDELQRRIDRYHRDYADWSQSIKRLVSDCRALASRYQVELHRLSANAEAAARTRYLRLYLIADAEIPQIGAGRKQLLAMHNIFTAADVDEQTIREIKGFGYALTGNLLAWKKEVLAQFRFNHETSVSPNEQRPVTLEFRTRQQQILAELDGQLRKLDSLAPACRVAIQDIVPDLQQAVQVYEQADADLRLLHWNR
jgi:DNA-binding helix-hairpin-helix protein with protein kinase domain